MAENGNAKRPETQYVAYTEVTNPEGEMNKDFIVTNIGTTRKSLTKYQIVFLVPNVEKCADMTVKEFFAQDVFTGRDFDGQAFVNAGFRKISTSPVYDTLVNRGTKDSPIEPTETPDPTSPSKPFLDYELVEDGHAKMQALADGYSLGRKASENAVEKARQKAQTAKMDSLEAEMAEAGVDMDTIREMIAKKAAKNKK